MASEQRRYSAYCCAINKDGSRCSRRVPTRPSGVYIRGPLCWQHSRIQVKEWKKQ